MRLCDVLFAFPGILLAIGIVAILGGGMTNVIIAVAIFSIPTFARLVRGNTLALKHLTYVEAARSIGASDWTIVVRHIFPGTIAAVVVYFSLRIGTSIITAASLSFIGMGAQPPTPEWGAMLNEARADMMTSPHVALFPSLAIFFTVLAFNLLGDGCATRWIRRSSANEREAARRLPTNLEFTAGCGSRCSRRFFGGIAAFFALGGHHYLAIDAIQEHPRCAARLYRARITRKRLSSVSSASSSRRCYGLPDRHGALADDGFAVRRWVGVLILSTAGTIGATLSFWPPATSFARPLRHRLGTLGRTRQRGLHARRLPLAAVSAVDTDLPLFSRQPGARAHRHPGTDLRVAATFPGIFPSTFVFANLG